MTDKERLPTITHTICLWSINREAVIWNNEEYCISLCTCVVRDSLHISDLKRASRLQWGLCFPRLFTASWYFPQLELVYGVKTFLPVKLQICWKDAGCNYAAQMKPSSPAKALFSFFFLNLCVMLCHRSKFTGLEWTLCPHIRLH